MRTSSAKAKGRRLAAAIRDLLLAHAPSLAGDDIIVTPSGVTGEDIRLSPKARQLFPFTIEAKNQESIQIWKAFSQATEHEKATGHTPLVVFSRNRAPDALACLRLRDLLALMEKLREPKETP